MPKTLVPNDPPKIQAVGMMQPLIWLVMAWRDIAKAGWVSVMHGVAMSVIGLAIVAVTYNHFWLLAGALSGFLVIAPVLATSLCALSRAIQHKEKPNFSVVLKTWFNRQNNHFNKWNNDYWCMLQFGILLAVAATGWVFTSAALITLLAAVPINGPMDFVRHVMLTPDGWLFEVWLAVGGVLAAPMFASSVVAMPLFLDRRVTLMQAVLTSWQTVLANPIPLAFWASINIIFKMLGIGSLMLGLVFMLPMLGHASWHAYHDLVDASHLPARDSFSASDDQLGNS
jgi:uncharacterized membrane protein